MTEMNRTALYIANECIKAGMTVAGAAGVLANVEAESAFRSTNVQDAYEGRVGNDASYTAKVDNGSYKNFAGDKAGYGLAQWTLGSRKAELLAYAKKHGVSVGDLKMQTAFIIYEMQRDYRSTWDVCASSEDPFNCGYVICMRYERPADTEAQANYRGGLARKWSNWLSAAETLAEKVTVPEDQPIAVDEDGIAIPQTWPPRMIDEHCTGFPEIRLLQSLLVLHGYNVLMDGLWTAELTRALRIFQGANGLQADGIVGPLTWDKLGIKI